MAEPIPSASNAAPDSTGAAGEAEESPAAIRLPQNAEDRKAAVALNSLNTNELTQDNASQDHPQGSSCQADQEALGKAMSRLEMAGGSTTATAPASKDGAQKGADEKAPGEIKKKIKVSTEDVSFLVSMAKSLSVMRFS